jgi:hypothetical protein
MAHKHRDMQIKVCQCRKLIVVTIGQHESTFPLITEGDDRWADFCRMMVALGIEEIPVPTQAQIEASEADIEAQGKLNPRPPTGCAHGGGCH